MKKFTSLFHQISNNNVDVLNEVSILWERVTLGVVSKPKRYEDMTPEERGASRHIKREGHKRRETKGKPNTFGLTSNNRNTKKNPPKGGWV